LQLLRAAELLFCAYKADVVEAAQHLYLLRGVTRLHLR
jgi:hypothetical protein